MGPGFTKHSYYELNTFQIIYVPETDSEVQEYSRQYHCFLLHLFENVGTNCPAKLYQLST